jgi:Tfp pilus assembly protein PilN
MIKINLSRSTKQLDLSNVGGLDFSLVKIKALLIVIVLVYIPDFVILPLWQSEIETLNQDLSAKQTELGSLKRKLGQAKNFEKQIEELKAQEESLGKKLLAVKQAISFKKNPAALILYLAKNTPPELWIKDLTIQNDVLEVVGEANDYASIGKFIDSMKSSVFIRDYNMGGTNSVVREDRKRVETFSVKFGIARFDQ